MARARRSIHRRPADPGQWELRLQTDIDLARRALRDALAIPPAGRMIFGGGRGATAPAPPPLPAEPAPAALVQAYALTGRDVSGSMLDGWAPPTPGKKSGISPATPPPPPPVASESASGSTSELTECSASISSAPNRRAAPVAAQLFVREEEKAAAGGEVLPLSEIESWLLEDGGGEQKPAHDGLLLDAALHNFGF
ncbi:hypothetical protein C2845_PM01G16590 [Panicum miliaceum]|uniref:Uncharacterized protein n=1 Tax=Panicum miliaceum TaxID=4540 RepID=A0A3L6TGY4_PANMI|nr:hypothetical protein C2845_PM01G16590 [Panicum miliaceum]